MVTLDCWYQVIVARELNIVIACKFVSLIASEYECVTGKVSCISSDKLCDGQNDCDDNSDELLCHSKTTPAGTSTPASTGEPFNFYD